MLQCTDEINGGSIMIRLRPFKESDAPLILSWCREEKAFYQWTAGVLGPYPLTADRFAQTGALMRFTALNDREVCGFFTLRNPGETQDEVRFGFVIVDPALRGQGVGRQMLRLGLIFAREVYGAKKASLGVFENNAPALRCYLAAGFREAARPTAEAYSILGETWTCREMEAPLIPQRGE